RAGDSAAIDWISKLRKELILSAWAAEVSVGESVQMADSTLRAWWARADTYLNTLASHEAGLAKQARESLEWMLLLAALNPAQRDTLRRDAVDTARRATRDLPSWSRQLGQEVGDKNVELPVAILASIVLPAAQATERARQ